MEPFQAELGEYIRRLRLTDDRVNLLGRRAYALSQGIRDLYSDGLGGNNACVTTITGFVSGGVVDEPLPGTSLRIIGHVTGQDYGTYFLPTGEYELALIIDQSDFNLDLYAIGPAGVRFNGSVSGPWAKGFPFGFCRPNPFGGIICAPAPGYVYLGQLVAGNLAACAFPVKQDTMGWEDSLGYSGTAGWTSGQSWNDPTVVTRPTIAFDYSVFGGIVHCDAKPAIDSHLNWELGVLFRIYHSYDQAPGGRCPDPTGSMSSGDISQLYVWDNVSARTCPDESTKCSITFGTHMRGPFYAEGDWLRIFEP